jgi:hypothetical protein
MTARLPGLSLEKFLLANRSASVYDQGATAAPLQVLSVNWPAQCLLQPDLATLPKFVPMMKLQLP